MTFALVYILAAVLFLLLLISLGFKPKFIARITGGVIAFVGVAGIAIYGYGYFTLFGGTIRTVMRTLFSVFCMFLGRNEISAISAAPILQTDFAQVLIYLVHLLALYCTASAVVAAIGTNVIRLLNLILIHRGNLSLIFGASDDSLEFGKSLQEKGVVVFVDNGGGDALGGKILQMGSLLLSDDSDKTPTKALLRKLGIRPGKRHLSVYCLDGSTDDNLRFAANLRDVMEQAGIHTDQTSLTILVEDAAAGGSFQAAAGGDEAHYGYGSVLAVNRCELAARLMVRAYPPYRTVTFNEDGLAQRDFEALVIGFGSTGQAVLRSLVMNGQFEGSRFKATVVALDHSQLAGSFVNRYPGLLNHYDITFLDENARSENVYRYIRERIRNICYVAVCTGNEKENTEITRELTDYFAGMGRTIPILQCSDSCVSSLDPDTGLPVKENLFSPDVLILEKSDAMSMVINHQYNLESGNTALEDWASCDYFSRMSCRASADFIDAFLAMAGSSREEAAQEDWQPSETVMDNLGKTEHLRWCAFHYAMGYETMPEEVFNSRGETYLDQVRQSGTGTIRIGKDTQNRLHACLIGWDELDDLAQRECVYTGSLKDYKKMDLDNVRMIPAMLKEVAES